MRNVYYDTADLRLFRWGVTLRRREGGSDAGWHIKLPVDGADAGTRDELRLPPTDGVEAPAELLDVVTALVREAPLAPVVTLRTERTPINLLDAQGRATAELVDDTVAVLDGERTAAIFREIEVEGIPGPDGEIDESVLDDVVQALVDHGAVPGTMSKAAAALGPRTSAPPDVPEMRWPNPKDPAGEAVRAFLATHVRAFLLQDVRLRRDLPDSVHQVRVAARRLRSGLRVFRPLLEAEWADNLRVELAWAATSLGEARDADLVRLAAELPTTSPLILLRHTQALKRSDFKGTDDSQRPLSGKGRSQAKAIVPLISAYGIEQVHSSDAVRCSETVRRYAKSIGAPIQAEPTMSETGHADHPKRAAKRMQALLADPAPLLLCSHRPVLPTLVETIAGLRWNGNGDLDEKLPPGGFLVIHRHFDGEELPRIIAVERHTP
jgi:inorganic triphosphatase YgiF